MFSSDLASVAVSWFSISAPETRKLRVFSQFGVEERDWQGLDLDPTTFQKNPEREPGLVIRRGAAHFQAQKV